MERKGDIRKRVLGLRLLQSEEERRRKSAAIAERITGCRWFEEAERIFCYVDFRGEVQTRRIMETAWNRGKKVYVPRMEGSDIAFYEIASFQELMPGAFGILEPSGDRRADSFAQGLMILPGVAFDRRGNRIGYGKGCYDRYLAAHPGLWTIGAAFELQLVDHMETEKTDIRVQKVVTEENFYEVTKGSSDASECGEHEA